jgi:hypothetical protein
LEFVFQIPEKEELTWGNVWRRWRMRHLVQCQFADFGDCHFSCVTWGIIPMEGDAFEALFWAIRFHVGFHMGNCKFASVLGANA